MGRVARQLNQIRPENRTHATRRSQRTRSVTRTLCLKPPSSPAPPPRCASSPEHNRTSHSPASKLRLRFSKTGFPRPSSGPRSGDLTGHLGAASVSGCRGPEATAPRGPFSGGHRRVDGVLVSGHGLCDVPRTVPGAASDGAALGAREASSAPAAASRASANRPLRRRAGRLGTGQRVTSQRERPHDAPQRLAACLLCA